MKLFSLLMGNSTPADVTSSAAEQTDMSSESAMDAEQIERCEPIEQAGEPIPLPTSPPSPHYSINLDRLRRIFQALASLNQNKTTEAEVGEEPLQMRRKYQGIFERFEMRFGNKSNRVSKSRTMQNPKDRLLAFLNRRNSNAGSNAGSNTDVNKTKSTNWARENLNRLTSSMRHVKSDSFLAKKISRKHRRKCESSDDEHIRLPSMRTKKKRSTVARSKALIQSASETAHEDLVKNLQENSSQHCLDDIDFWNYDYPFENLVFEGGGAKVHTYIGAIKVTTSCDPVYQNMYCGTHVFFHHTTLVGISLQLQFTNLLILKEK